jgi:hypothetical protein
MTQKDNHWVARLHEPKAKTAGPGGPPLPPDDIDSESAPTDDIMPDEDLDALLDEGSEDGEEDKGNDKAIADLTKLVEQIAEAVGVPIDGEKGEDGPIDEPMDDPLPPMDEPMPPKGGPPMAPSKPTPVGSPAFASTKTAAPKVASFEVEEPWSGTIREAKDAIEAQYGEFGYKVKKITEARKDGQRCIRARVSVR